ncbi:RluA family pseudouridine synthase [Desulfofustis glycolicus]|uniref:tRNA pseudouridine32 synthase / 23S rRNA pseudouridine746 synthase n=1 Tax=Desulfofustis glycolicus DSM 9705 TaxID=1121409 RepID=A0A1M5THT1_9BACT|nr:RluA family pseudouridine synthase [Desulfofustis glycolicus]MCB2216413.1 RluA family pseudouridine synthase [Desulfobulbaceae bacterium]SHH50210.1 tRNA pseudouridine32 synthase / 23S rRNA pseudouridine746 synthase [Desulfofustis glycolicus DSM 9705]
MAVEPDIVFCDDQLVLIDKPAGLLAVPGRGPARQDCAVVRVRRRVPDLPKQPAVHRLDMATSGLMLLARTTAAHRELARQFEHRLVIKRYIAVLCNAPPAPSGIIEMAFRLDPEDRPRQIFDPVNGRVGVTLWQTLGEEPLGTRVEFTPLTGRTHQLRVHAAHPRGLNAPIVGDSLYGSSRMEQRLLLHASYLLFYHPASSRPLEFHRPPPF